MVENNRYTKQAITSIMRELRIQSHSKEELAQQWTANRNSVGDTELGDVILAMAGDDLYRWLLVIGNELKNLLPSGRFVGVSLELVEKVGGDLGGDPLWRGIVEAGMTHPDIAKQRIDSLLRMRDTRASVIAAMLMRGIVESDPVWFESRIRQLLANPEETDKAAAFRALNCHNRDTHPSDWTVRLVLSSAIPRTLDSQAAYVSCLDSIAEGHTDEVAAIYLTMLDSTPDQTVTYVLRDATRNKALSTDHLKMMLAAVKDKLDPRIRESVMFALIRVYGYDPQYVLDFIHETGKQEFLSSYFGFGNLEYLLNEMGKINRDIAYAAVDSWIDEHDSRLFFETADILELLFSAYPLDLITRIRNWSAAGKTRPSLRLQILKDIISERLDTEDEQKREIIDECVGEVFTTAKDSSLPIDSIVAGTKSKVYQALMIVDSILRPVRDVNFDQLFANLPLIPHVCKFMGREWFYDMRTCNAKGNLLLHMLDGKYPEDQEIETAKRNLIAETTDGHRKLVLAFRLEDVIRRRRVLEYWNDIFSRLSLNKPGISKCRNDLIQYNRTEDTLCELELISMFLRGFEVDVRGNASGLRGRYDLRVHLEEQEPVIEVYNPQPERILLYASGAHGLNTGRTKKKISDKLDKKITGDGVYLPYPYVFALHTTSAEVDVSDFQMNDALHGEKSLTVSNPRAESLSGIILYKRDLINSEKPRLIVDYYANPSAKNPLTEKSVAEMISGLS